RAPFFEMWGKPKDCREPQVDDDSIMDFLASVNPFLTSFFKPAGFSGPPYMVYQGGIIHKLG
ncbi:MAG: hypothetical protein K5922_06445, partial [Clostridiales bacterium]|nr:hypothetical protein [Clostridiales bacterium]